MMKKLSFGFLIILFLLVIVPIPSNASNEIVLNFEDLDDTGALLHKMSEHNPYSDYGITFHEIDNQTLCHWNNSDYTIPNSGDVFLFNGFGLDSLSIGFDSPVLFKGVWAGYPLETYGDLLPDRRAAEFWFVGYIGETMVGESAMITLEEEMQFCQANFSEPVDKIVFRRSGENSVYGFYTIDDMTFAGLTAPVPTPPEMMDDLVSFLETDMDLPKGMETNLAAKIDVATKALGDENENNDSAAINAMEAFINYVEAQRGKKIPGQQADELVSRANEVIASLTI